MTTPRSGRAGRVLFAVLGAALLLLGWAAPAWAHASLVSTSPAAGSEVETVRGAVELRFSERVDPAPGGSQVVRSDGTGVDIGDVGRIDGDPTTVRIPLPDGELADDTYVVAWRVTSADSHPIRGAFTFQVGAGGAADTSALVSRVLADQGGTPATGAVLAIGRWASYAGVVLCAGWSLFALLGLSVGGPAARLGRLVARSAGLGAAGTLVMLGGQAVSITARWSAMLDPGAYGDVLRTESGRWWGIRLLLLAVVGLVAVVGRRRRAALPAPAVSGCVVAVALTVVTANGGHAVSGRWPLAGLVATVVHLLSLAVWAAGLVTLTLLVRGRGAPVVARSVSAAAGSAEAAAVPSEAAAGSSPGPSGERALAAFAPRFSSWALLAVLLLVGSGVVNSVRQVGDLDLLTSTDYGRLLIAKLVAVAVLLAVGFGSRRRTGRAEYDGLVRPVRAEVALAAVALVATALLVNQRPAISERTSLASAYAVQGNRTAEVVLDPARTGGTEMHVYLTSPGGTLDRAQSIVVTATLEAQDIGPLELPLYPGGPNHVTSPDVDLPLPGTWTIDIAARYGQFEEVRFRTSIDVRS